MELSRHVADGALVATDHGTRHAELGPTAWYTVEAGTAGKQRAAYRHGEPPGHADELRDKVAFAWRAMDDRGLALDELAPAKS